MPQVQILFHAKRINKDTLLNTKYQETLNQIISGAHSHIEWLASAHYAGQRIGSARIDRVQHGQRLIFTYLPNAQGQRCLFILGETPHNYNQVERWLKTTGITSVGSLMVQAEVVDIRFIDFIEEHPVLTPQEGPHLAFLDDAQQQALSPSVSPLMFLGPAGAGKTLILETFMSNHLDAIEADPEQASSSTDTNACLFVSQSELLLDSLRKECEVPEVTFSTWERMLAAHFQGQKKITHNEFKLWLQKQAPDEDAEQVHFELSLIVAYGEAAYLALQGARQTYYSGNEAKQKQCIVILKAWQKHTHTTNAYDPMTSLPPPAAVKSKTYCDEGQNFPPSALAYFMGQAQAHHFYISFDPEQSLTSPFTYAFIKQQLNNKGYTKIERLLDQTWRNSPEVVEVINAILKRKHDWDNNTQKRPYSAIRSAQAPGGLVSWVTNASFSELKKQAQDASTVVIAELPEDPEKLQRERQEIIEHMGTRQILSASTVIGMTFKTVILWKPISLNATIRELFAQKSINGLTLKQWIALNAIQIALGRAQGNIFIYEPNEHFRLKGELCFGELPTDATLKKNLIDDKKNQIQAWEKKVDDYLTEGATQLAIDLMQHQLLFTEAQIKQKLNPVNELSPQPHESKPKAKKNQSSKTKKSAPAPSVPQPSQLKVSSKTPTPAKKTAAPVALTPKIPPSLSQLEIIAIVKSLNAAFAEEATEEAKLNVKSNLEKLLRHPQAMRYLFYSSNTSNNCLAIRLLSSNEHQQMLFDYLRDNKTLSSLINSPNPDKQPPLLDFLAQTGVGIQFFKDSLNQTLRLNGADCSLFYSWTASESKIDFLYEWLQINPQLSKGISGKMLCLVRPESGVMYANASPLYWLSSSGIGQNILYLLLGKNPQLATEITKKALCLPRTGANTPPLYWLSCTPTGRIILDILQSKNKELAKVISEAKLLNAGTTEDKTLNELITSRSELNSQSQLTAIIHMSAPTTKLFPGASELHIPLPWNYVSAPEKQQKVTLLDSHRPEQESLIIKPNNAIHYFCATTFKLPITPLPPSFLQATGYIVNKAKQPAEIILYFKYPEGTNHTKPPVSLRTLLLDPQYKPTMTQLVDFMTKISVEMDWLSSDLTFYPSLDTIFITNPEQIGTERAFKFQLCPSALLLNVELKPGLERYQIHRHMLAILFLHLATQTTDLNEPMPVEKINAAQQKYPAFIAAFIELWESTCKLEVTPEGRMRSMQQLSPTISALHKIRITENQTWSTAEFFALLSGTASNHAEILSSVSAPALLNLYQNSNAEDKLLMTRHLAQSVELLMPRDKSDLTVPSSISKSERWMSRMNLISALLQELAQQDNLDSLHQTQQRLLAAGIGNQLGGNLSSHNGSFALAVLVPAIKVSTWMSFQFATIKVRLIFERNVKKMAQMLFDATVSKENSAYITTTECEQYILMMLIMSDFGKWITPSLNSLPNPDDIDTKLLTIWNNIDLQLLLDFGLPCSHELLSPMTTQLIEKKLGQHVTRLIQKSTHAPLSDNEQQQLCTSLSYMKSFAWCAHEQVTNASFQSLSTSHFIALAFSKPQQTVFYEQKSLPPINPIAPSMQQLVDAAQASINQPLAVSSRQQRKLALSPLHLIGCNSAHNPIASHHFIPDAAASGAPKDIEQFIFSLPANGLIQYHHNAETGNVTKTSFHSLRAHELKKLKQKFIPTTLSTAQRICRVQDKKTGTQGMFEVGVVDAGESNSLLIGLTSNKTLNGENTIPGATATSIALDAATGNIRFLAEDGKQIEYPYTKPIHSGSKVFFGITGKEVYCIVDNTFYPPIRGFELPVDADIHPLIRIGCPDVKLSSRVMGAVWTMARNADGSLLHAPSNPVAHSLYLAELRTQVCPHYHAKKQGTGIDRFTELLSTPQLIAKQELNIQLDLLMTLLAGHECLAEHCVAPPIIRKLISDINCPVTASPERVLELTNLLGLTELESAIKQRFSERSSVVPLSLFTPDKPPVHSNELNIDKTNQHLRLS
ncbi:hypothetical protein ACD661_04490 [Legionella lytica]|uniref:Uncharacterized protein n=1 Tax=Legionella lytica TaxID=96232 RepID=A0ABW8D557_9GAMM